TAGVIVPRHGGVIAGGGTVSIGLTPPDPISVEPNGTPVGRTVEPLVPSDGTAAPELTPPEIAVVEPVVQPDIEPVMPPDVDMVDPLIPPFIPEPLVIPPNVVPQPPSIGLNPPGLISVAPIGIPVPVEPVVGNVVPVKPIIPVELLMPGMPRGDVGSITEAGGITLCACSGPHPN